MEIPGFYYDRSRKKYFKIEKNSDTHIYTSSSLKHKREEDELRTGLSRLRMIMKQRQPMLESQILSIKSKISHQSVQKIASHYKEYSIARLDRHLRKEIFDVNTPSRKMALDTDGCLYIANDNYLLKFSRIDGPGSSVIPEIKFVDNSIKDSVLRSMEPIASMNGIVRLWSGILNTPSRLCLSKDNCEVFKYEINKELLNASKVNVQMNRLSIVGTKVLRILNLDNLSIMDAPSMGDCLSVDAHEWKSYLGYRNGHFRIWDIRSTQLNSVEKFSRPIINVSRLSEFEILISTLDEVFSYDLRNRKRLKEFHSLNSAVDPFKESLATTGQSNKDGFMLQSPNTVEFFRLSDVDPVMTISKADLGANEINCSVYDERANCMFTSCDSNVLMVTR